MEPFVLGGDIRVEPNSRGHECWNLSCTKRDFSGRSGCDTQDMWRRYTQSTGSTYIIGCMKIRFGALFSGGCLFLALLNAAPESGREAFESRCAKCHGGDGNGGEFAPGIVSRLTTRHDQDLSALIRAGIPGAGMPSFDLANAELADLIGYLRTLKLRRGVTGLTRGKVELTDGHTLSGVILNQSAFDMQMLADDQIHLLRKEGARYRRVTSQVDWPTYNGQLNGNRYSTIKQITKENVRRLAPQWIFTVPSPSRLEVTPVVVDGIMYVTNANECYAIDAGTGRQIWLYQRPRTKGLIGNAAGGINRGIAVSGHRVFMETDNAHLIALNRFTGALLWDIEIADWHQNYNATSAPMAVDGLVIAGTAGGEEGVRGFLAAYDEETGKEVWRFWTVPKRGEPLSETWKGDAIDHPGGITWQIGSYDAETHTLYWPTGNPSPDYNGDQRQGDNLYASCVLALDSKTGKLKWYYQFTPHNVWDWDAQQPQVLIDREWKGQPRKLMVQAARNGFFYVFDRTDGKLLLTKPFVKKLTWAKEIGADDRPVMNPNQEPTDEGNKICPASHGAANWYSTSYDPDTGYYYLQTLEQCNIFKKGELKKWEAGRSYLGGSSSLAPGETGQKILRAIEVKTGNIAWELPQSGTATSRGGTLATAGGVVFFGEDSDAFMAVDSSTGKPLWRFQGNYIWRASPMTYMFDGKQYVSIASGPNVISFGLVE